MKRTVVFLSFIFLLTYCKSSLNEPTIPIEKVTDYFPLTIGNCWVYKIYYADSTLNFSDYNQIDSLYVQKDSTVNGNIYKVVKSTFLNQTLLLRDSSNYLVTSDGKKILTTNNSDEILSREYYYASGLTFSLAFKMKSSDSTSSVPVGNYQSKYVTGTLVCTNTNNKYKNRRVFYAYAKNVGLVSRRMAFVATNAYLEERLIKYNIFNK